MAREWRLVGIVAALGMNLSGLCISRLVAPAPASSPTTAVSHFSSLPPLVHDRMQYMINDHGKDVPLNLSLGLESLETAHCFRDGAGQSFLQY